jgi:beta-glucuronidase
MKKIYIILLAGLCFYAQAQNKQPLPEHPRPDLQRDQWLNLNGYWDFTFDSSLTVPAHYAKKILVPFPWGSPLSEVKDEADVAWYHKAITIPATWTGKRIFLNIGASDWETSIYLDGVKIGSHQGGYTPFDAELAGVKPGSTHQLAIRVDDKRRMFTLYGKQGYGNARGIWQTVYLEARGSNFVDHYAVNPDIDAKKAQVKVYLGAPVSKEQSVQVALSNGQTATLKIAAGKQEGSVEIPIKMMHLWSLEDPHLYEVGFECGEDVLHEKIGFRHIEVRGTQLVLNGQVLFLRGICVHEDDVVMGKVSTEADVRRRLADAKEMGCNFLRLSHYPHHEHVAQLADEVGLLLWEEIPVYWAIEFDNPKTLADARNQLQELILRDINRASVIFWGVGNENADSDARLAFMSELAQTAKQLDSTRLISAACLINREEFCIQDRLTAHLDVIGLNEYFGWYEPGFSGLQKLLANSKPDKPVLITETGADALAGHRGPQTALFTEDCQAFILSEQVRLNASFDYVCGIAPWLLYDFLSERRQTIFNKGFNRKGVIAQDKKTRKLGFYALKEAYEQLSISKPDR